MTRAGFHSVTPYLFVHEAPRLIDFITRALSGAVVSLQHRPDGNVMHAEVKIGDSMVMLAEASPPFGPFPTSLYVYVPDCDATFQAATAAGGVSVFPLQTMPSGERYGGVTDPCGNLWWIATHIEDLSPEEQARRWKAFRS